MVSYIALPPCACCTDPVTIIDDKKGSGEKKIHVASCCGASVCYSCRPGGLCLFCKKIIENTSWVRKTGISNWRLKFSELKGLESLAREPFFFTFLKSSKCPLDYKDSWTIRLKLRQYITIQHFKRVIQVRVSPPKSFIFRTSDDIQRFQRLHSVLKSRDFDRIYQQHFHKSAVVMRYSRKYRQFGCIFFIALKLSTMLLTSEFLSDVNAICRIIYRFTKNNPN